MSFWTDIAQTAEAPRAANALHVQLPGKDLFVVCEAGEATGAAAQLVPVALGAIVGSVAAATSTSATRILDAALEQANRAIFDAKRFNPLVAEILVSVSCVLRDHAGLHYATVGANGIFFRSGGSCRRLNESESESRHLISEGITTDPLPGGSGDGSRPSNGLGLPADLFRVRQSASLSEPEDYLLVIAGGRAASRLGTVHIETISPVGDAASTASRLLRQSGLRPEDGSAICAAHKSHDYVVGEAQSPGQGGTGLEREPLLIPWKPILGGLALLAALGLLLQFVGPCATPSQQPPAPVLAPTSLLPQKEPGQRPERDWTRQPDDLPLLQDVTLPTVHGDSRGLPDVQDVQSDTEREVNAKDDDVADGGVMPNAEAEAEREARRQERRRLRRERERARRAEKEARLREKRAAEAKREEPDVLTSAGQGDVIQVIDFTKPDPDVVPQKDLQPTKRTFPEAKLELPDVTTGSAVTLDQVPAPMDDSPSPTPSAAAPDAVEVPL